MSEDKKIELLSAELLQLNSYYPSLQKSMYYAILICVAITTIEYKVFFSAQSSECSSTLFIMLLGGLVFFVYKMFHTDYEPTYINEKDFGIDNIIESINKSTNSIVSYEESIQKYTVYFLIFSLLVSFLNYFCCVTI